MTDDNRKLTSEADRIWQEFLDWIPNAEKESGPTVLIRQYRSHVISLGESEEDFQVRLQVIGQRMRASTDGWRTMFNRIYRSTEASYSTAPSDLLRQVAAEPAAGRALDLGMGQGRNAIYLAGLGWQVTGLDVADEGVAAAQANAQRAGVEIEGLVADGRQFDFGQERWDLIVATYVPFPLTDPTFVARLERSLRPGGMIVIESFATADKSMGAAPVAVDPIELQAAYSTFDIVVSTTITAAADWTLTESIIAQFVAKKLR